jgi:CelD/BcsL family acetyltransferase involved in cellulose biosynthesis
MMQDIDELSAPVLDPLRPLPTTAAGAPRIEHIDPLTDPRWQAFVETTAEGMIFHHRAWLELLHRQYGYGMSALCAIGEDGEITAGLPLAYVKSRLTGSRRVCVPFADVCGPIAAPDRQSVIETLLDVIRTAHERDELDVEIRTPIAGFGAEAGSFYHHSLELEADPEVVRKRFRSNVRNIINKAHREGVVVVRDTSREALDDFYRLHLLTRRRLGVPTQPKRFIRRFEDLFDQGLGFVLRAQLEDRTIASAVFLTFNETVLYKYSASDPAFMRKNGNYALLMDAIRWGCENGYRRFDMGRTDFETEGLRAFKRGWGTTEQTLSYTRLSTRPTASSHGGVPSIVRTVLTHSPPIGSRIVGAVLYKHFA